MKSPARTLAALELLPGWWRGRAAYRRDCEREARARGLDRLADHHHAMAQAYESRIKAGVSA